MTTATASRPVSPARASTTRIVGLGRERGRPGAARDRRRRAPRRRRRFLQPNPGTSAGDHLVGGLVPLALLVVAGVLYGRLRAGRARSSRSSSASSACSSARRRCTTRWRSARRATTTRGCCRSSPGSCCSVSAASRCGGHGAETTASGGATGGGCCSPSARCSSRCAVLFPVSVAYVVTHAARAARPARRPRRCLRERPVHDERRTAAQGLVHPVAERRRGDLLPRTRVLAAAGEAARAARLRRSALRPSRRGRERGRPQPLRLAGRARHPRRRRRSSRAVPTSIPERIGGIGLSVGGEMMIEAAAESPALKAIVSEGASSRSVRDELANPGGGWSEIVGNGVATLATAIFTDNLPPATLKSLVPQISGAVFFVYGERGQPAERAREPGVLRGGARAEGDLGGPGLGPHRRRRGAAGASTSGASSASSTGRSLNGATVELALRACAASRYDEVPPTMPDRGEHDHRRPDLVGRARPAVPARCAARRC